MTRGQQVLAQLVLGEVRAGRLTIQGDRFIRNGVAVRPVLAFERDEAPAKSAVAAVIRRSAGESEVRYPQFAALPEDRLVPSDKGMTQQRQAPAELPRDRVGRRRRGSRGRRMSRPCRRTF